jgi:hypothetical protein
MEIKSSLFLGVGDRRFITDIDAFAIAIQGPQIDKVLRNS